MVGLAVGGEPAQVDRNTEACLDGAAERDPRGAAPADERAVDIEEQQRDDRVSPGMARVVLA
ncbi:MAG: hypothetical protein QN178_09040 [Armatimonadota bacterium]|nr:hypothetical protein [Armatimonadota bacterium]